jgi:hypothetical protein
MLYSPFWLSYVYENMQAKKLNGFDVPIATVEDELELSCSSSYSEWKVESLYMVTLPHQDKKIFRSTSYLAIPQKTNEFTLNNFSSLLAI